MRAEQFLKRFCGAQEGGAIVEFALVFPLLASFTLAILDFSYVAFADASLEGAVREAARRGITGYVPSAGSRDQYVRQRILDAMAPFALDGEVVITTRVYGRFSDIGEPEPFSDANGNGVYDAGECFTDVNQNGLWDADMARSGLGGAGDVVVYQAQVRLMPMTPFFVHLLGRSDPAITLSASTAVRNEPFSLVQEGANGGAIEICG
ncbi:MAG: pilus assembly protein [Alphaproteobacteria bacterium]|nr:MAG: pilus assembly protein [Alphaproteobacteria bacterium]